MAFLTQLYRTQEGQNRGPFIIVAPLSLINQWQGEASTWAPDLNVLVYHGNADSRQVLREYEFYFDEPYIRPEDAYYLKQNNIVKFDILLTTYETVIKDIKILSRVAWKVLVVDEAHRLKNPASRLFMELKTLPRDHCVLLTGTPLQNKTEELWALLNFADPIYFGDHSGFNKEYGDLKDASQVESLHNMLKPFLLRRIKEDVEKSLPPKEETIVEVSLTPLQRKFYMAIYDRNTTFLFKETKASMAPSLMNVMMELRKCCNHAYLNRGVEERILSEIPEAQRTPENLHHQLVSCSGKMVLLDKLLPRLKKEGHKVLIFSQMVRVLDLVEDYMRFVGHSYERLDGTKKATERSAAVVRFNNPALNRFIMLLSTRAGGLGLNLTAADTVIIYDSDWNPHNDLQAQARAHRIGQTKAVKVYRLLTRKSYEVEMFHAASMKLGLDRAVLAHQRAEGEMEAGAASAAAGVGMSKSESSLLKPTKAQLGLSHTEVEHLLKRGAYDVFRGDDKEGQEFQEADIDQILQRQSHKVVYGNQESLTKNLASSFSKASFVSTDNKEDIDLDDPEFWKKAIGLTEPEKEASTKLLGGLATTAILGEGEKRKRKRNERFDAKAMAGLDDVLGGYDSAYEGDSLDDSGGEDGSHSGSSDAHPKRRGRPRKGEAGKHPRVRSRAGSKGGQGTPVGNGRFTVGPDGQVIPGGGGGMSSTGNPQVRRVPKWGPHSRDRLIRALLEFGFGRWERIRIESLASEVPLGEVESFCRSYVLQCGLCAGEGKRPRHESKFVKDAIAAATKLAAQMKSGEIVIPEVLQDERFLLRLRQGLARKALVRLDLLLRLQSPVINEAVRLAFVALTPEQLIAKGLPPILNQVPDHLVSILPNFEERFSKLSKAEVAKHIVLGDVRPTWTQATPWWDLECDRHLLVGVYAHGFQNYNAIRDDPDLCFQKKMEAWLVRNPKGFMVEKKPAPLPFNGKEQQMLPIYTWSPLQVFLKLPCVGVEIKEEGKVDKKGEEKGGGGEVEGGIEEEKQQSHYIRAVTLPGKRVSKYRGVYAQPGSAHWAVQIQQMQGTQCVGSYASEEKAALAYDAAARKLYGPEAETNFTRAVSAIGVAAAADTAAVAAAATGADAGAGDAGASSPSPSALAVGSGTCSEAELSPSARLDVAAEGEGGRESGGAKASSAMVASGSNNSISSLAIVKSSGSEPPRRRPEVTKAPNHELPLVWHRSSLYRGVRAAGPKWTAQISYNGQNHHLGTFNSELEAALAYDALSRRYHQGQTAVLNFPEGPELELDRIDALMQELTESGLPGGWSEEGAEEAAAMAATKIAREEARVSVKKEKEVVVIDDDEVGEEKKKEARELEVKEEEKKVKAEEGVPDRVVLKVDVEEAALLQEQHEQVSAPTPNPDATDDDKHAATPAAATAFTEGVAGEGTKAEAVAPQTAPRDEPKKGSEVKEAAASAESTAAAEAAGTGAEQLNISSADTASATAEMTVWKEGGGEEEQRKENVEAASFKATAAAAAAAATAAAEKGEAMVGTSGTAMQVGEEGEMSRNVSLAEKGEKKEGEGSDENAGEMVKKDGDGKMVTTDEPLIKKHWPDNYKMLNKLVTWLIDDPDARETQADVKKRLEEEGLRVTEGKVVRQIKRRPSEEDERGMSTSGRGSGGEKGSPSSFDPENKKIKTSISGVSARGVGVWSTDDCRRLCNALLVSGAPLSNPALPVTLFLATAGRLSHSALVDRRTPSADGSVDQVIGYLPTFTWNDVRLRAGLPAKTPEDLQAFYVTELLPLFQRLCTHREPLPESGDGLSAIPDPSKSVLEHTAGSRSIAYTFMRRQQLVRAIRFILEKEPKMLVEYLGSTEGKNATGNLPGWWMGTRLDVSLMLGACWKGLLCIDQIRKETMLGLCDAAIEGHLRKTVIEKVAASEMTMPSDAEFNEYAQRAMAAFPDRKVLEERLHRNCIIIARHVPATAELRFGGARGNKSPGTPGQGSRGSTPVPAVDVEKGGANSEGQGGRGGVTSGAQAAAVVATAAAAADAEISPAAAVSTNPALLVEPKSSLVQVPTSSSPEPPVPVVQGQQEHQGQQECESVSPIAWEQGQMTADDGSQPPQQEGDGGGRME